MTVAGLPTAAGTALRALLQEHFVTSWRIVGSGEKRTFVWRLSPAAIDSDTATSFAHTRDNKEPPAQCDRRKPPSQIRRDQKRAEKRKAKVCQQASDFSFLRLFGPTDDNTPLLDNGHNTAIDARAAPCDCSILDIDDLCSGVSVITHAEGSFCDSEQDEHGAHVHTSQPLFAWIGLQYLHRIILRRLHVIGYTVVLYVEKKQATTKQTHLK